MNSVNFAHPERLKMSKFHRKSRSVNRYVKFSTEYNYRNTQTGVTQSKVSKDASLYT